MKNTELVKNKTNKKENSSIIYVYSIISGALK
jgi:hypothetical protein